MRDDGCEAEVLGLAELGGGGGVAGGLSGGPVGDGVTGAGDAEDGVGVGGETGIGQAGGDEPVVRAGGLVLVGAFDSVGVLVEGVEDGNGVVRGAGAEE